MKITPNKEDSSPTWLPDEIRSVENLQLKLSDPSRICWHLVAGDSMKGTIDGGDWVAIDMFDKGVGQGGVFALRDCTGEVIVKRVRWVRGSHPQKIELISDNPKQGSETEFLSKIEIIGRVIGRTTRV
jgi:phage repressor protein C with HTH and peptisase S24 domain